MQKRSTLLISFTIISVALIVGGFFFFRSSYLLNRIRLVLETQLEKQLKCPVTIGYLAGNVLTGLTIRQFEIADSLPENPDLISIGETKVKYKLWGLLRGKFLVTKLDFRQPQINARIDSDGNLNLARLTPENKPESTVKLPFQSLVSNVGIEDGTIYFADSRRNLEIAINGIYSRSRVDGPLEAWKHAGTLEIRDGRFELNGVETKIDELRTEFELQEDEGALRSLRLALGDSFLIVSGRASNLSEQSPFVETQIQLTLDFHDLQKILGSQDQMEGIMRVDVNASGMVSEIAGRVGLTLPFARLNALHVENLIAQAEFTQDNFRLTKIDGTVASGKLTGGAEIDLSPQHSDQQGLTYSGWLQLASLQAEQLMPMLVGLPENFLVVKGELDGKIQFSGTSPAPRDLNLDGNLQLTRATLNDVPICVSVADYKIDADRLSLTANLDEAQIELDGGLGLANPLDLDLRITRIDVGKLLRILGIPHLAGEGKLTGKVSHEILLSAQLDIPEATLNDVPIGVLIADFHYADNRVFLHPVRLTKDESELIIDGVARLEGDIPIELMVCTQPFQISDYVRLAGSDYPIEGVATGELVLDGTLGKLDGRGTLQIVNGKAWDLAFDALTLPLEIEDYVVKIPDFALITRGQRGFLTVQIDTNLDYEIDFQSEPMQLAELALARDMTDFQLDANLVVKANGKANARNPRIDLSVDFLDVTYAGKPLRDVYITGIYTDNALNFKGVGFNETCQIRGMLESAAGAPYQIAITGSGVDVLPIARIFNDALDRYLTGMADGDLEISGTLADTTQFKLQMSLSELALDVNGQQLVNRSPINICLADNLWHIQSFALADRRALRPFLSGLGTFRVESANQRGVSDSQSKTGSELEAEGLTHHVSPNVLDFVVEGDGFALEHLAELLGLPPIISGIGHYTLTGSGTFENPRLTLDWAIPDMRIQTPVASLAVSEAEGHLNYKDQHLTVERGDFHLLGNPVRIHGCIPLDFGDQHLLPDTCQLSIQSDGFQLTSLDGLFPQISQLGGHLDIEVKIAGDLFHPELTASIHMVQGTMQLLDFPQPLEDLEIALGVSGGQKSSHGLVTVDLKSANWQLGGGRYQAKGNWRLSKTATESSLSSVVTALTHNNPVEFWLQLGGEGVNLIDLANYVVQREIPQVEGRANISLNLQGKGYNVAGVSATLVCEDLHIDINNRVVRNLDGMRFQIADRKLSVEPFRIGEGDTAWFNTAGSVDVDGNIDLHLELDRFPYAVLIPAITLTLFDKSLLQLDGYLTSQIMVGGNLVEPIIMGKWTADGHFGSAKVEDAGYATYRKRLLVMQNTQRIVGVDKQLSVFGNVPIDLAFQPLNIAERFLDQSIDLRIQGQQIPLHPLGSLFHPLIEQASGTADIDLRIQGTTASPYLQGELLVEEGMLKLVCLNTAFSKGRIELRADKGEVRLPELSFQIGQGKYETEVNLQMNGLVPTDFEISRFNVRKAGISDFVHNFLAEDLRGYITAEASLNIPVDQFIIPGETAWTPKLIAPFNLPNLVKHATGRLSIQNVFVEGLGYDIRNPKPIEIRLTNQRLNLGNGFTLEDQKVVEQARRLKIRSGFGDWALGKRLRFSIGVQNFDLGFLSGFLPDSYSVRGFLNASLDIHGTDAEPKITFRWNTPELWINEARVDKFIGNITYEDQKIQIGGPQSSDAFLLIGRNRASLSGLIPFHLSLLDLKAKPLSQDIEGRLDIAIEDLDFLPLIIPQIGAANCIGAINMTIGGQIQSPALKGFADLKELMFVLPDSHLSVENTRVNLAFTDRTLDIRRFDGRVNDGMYKIDGSIQSNWLNVHHMDVSAELIGGNTFEQPGLYWIKCRKANLAMKGNVITNGNVKLPPLRGTINIDEGRYQRHWQQLIKDLFDKKADVQFEVWFDYPIVRHLQLDLNTVAPNNLWVESDLGKIKVEASVNGKIVGPIQKPIFSGRVNLLEGEISLFAIDHQFNIQSGSYIENKDQIEFNPWYEITTKTAEPIRNVEIENTDGQIRVKDLNIIVNLSGYLNGPHRQEFHAEVLRKEASEEYQLTQTQLLAILTLGRSDPLASEVSPADDASDLFLRQSQRYLSNRFAEVTGLSGTRFDLSPNDLEKSRFLFTQELFERLILTYSSTFQLHAEPRIEVEYQINPHFAIKGERTEQGKYGIDLKLEQRF